MKENKEVKVNYTRKRLNPYLAISEDGLNEAYGKTKQQAVENLKIAMLKRKEEGN